MSGWGESRAKGARSKVVADAIAAGGSRMLMTVSQIEEEFGISRRTVGRLADAGFLTPIVVGKRFRIARTDFVRYLEGRAA